MIWSGRGYGYPPLSMVGQTDGWIRQANRAFKHKLCRHQRMMTRQDPCHLLYLIRVSTLSLSLSLKLAKSANAKQQQSTVESLKQIET